ncbi:MAG TPA: protein-methionine-sulfoxide reductase catalytic subunit MsrP [Paracoccaceae bacterium]|nr:protein-methionine-sulfoxide reductase catalytic subunit MsrP [Paracoccaceae bacterium]
MIYQRRPSWALKESASTPEALYMNRRSVLAGLGVGAGVGAFGFPAQSATPEASFSPKPALNPAFSDAGRPVTDEGITSLYNNYYEFGSSKRISREAQKLNTDPWVVSIDGMVDTPFQMDVDDMIQKFGVEERIYRHRCVEAWSMVVPWIGFPLRKLLDHAKPLSSAKYVRFETFMNPKVASEQRAHWYPWPYVEGLTINEAANDLAFMVVGAYGKFLHKQFGAPMRLHLPWKYGFKSIKATVRITFTDERPVSFWEELLSKEYGFWANVNPKVDHPRWTQATEKPLDAGGDRVPTQLFNGYADQVAGLYKGMEAQLGDRLWR